MGNAYRDGWDRTFGPKESPRMLRCPFPLRRGLQIEVTLPAEGCRCATCVKLREVVTEQGEVGDVDNRVEAGHSCARRETRRRGSAS